MADDWDQFKKAAPAEDFSQFEKARKSPVRMQMAGAGSQAMGRAEAIASMVTQPLATIAGGIAGIGATAREGIKRRSLSEGALQGGQVARDVQGALTYEPRTERGQQALEKITAVPELLTQGALAAGGGISEATGSPALGAAAATTLAMVPAIVSRGARPSVERGLGRVAEQASMRSPGDLTLARGQELGFKALPEGPVGRMAAKIGGKDAVEQEVRAQNQEVVDRIARQEAGLGPKDPITREGLDQVMEVMEEPYRRVASLSPTAAQALDEMKVARRKKQLQMDHYRVSRNPDALEKAEQFGAEEAYRDRIIDHEATRFYDPGLLNELREARKRIAKNRTVNDALNEGAGIVNPNYIAGLDKKTRGKLLTGGLKDIANWVQAHPATVSGRPVEMPGATHFEAAEMLGTAMAGHPGLALGIPGLRTAGRSIALSRMAQPGVTGPGLGLSLADVATRPAATGAAALSPGLGLRQPREKY